MSFLRFFRSLAAAAMLAVFTTVPLAACAELTAGTPAPLFASEATLGGRVFRFDLAEALKKGPVVLYFYPAAFTPGCTIEAHDFAEHSADYRKLGATVIGISGDGIEKLRRFSVSECRSKFAVASDADLKIAHSYDAVLPLPVHLANRISYVIAPDGKIVYVYRSLRPEKHVENTLAALRKLKAS